jgi:flagellum-specific peptidoglycan hydrolase FlgJ
MDHIGGFFSMLKEKGLIMDMLVCYDPDSLKLAGSGSANARSVRDDKAYLQKLISKAKAAGAKIRYVATGDKLSVGQRNFKFYRKQPTAFGDQDNGQAYGYMNHGSLAIYNYELGTLYSADGPKSGADMLEYFENEDVEVVDSEHHGNGAGKTYAQSMKKRGVVLCIEANNEKNGPGSCEFTSFGSRRIIEAGVTVWMLNASVYGHAKNGTVTWKQTGKKTITYDTEFGRKAETPAAKTDQEKFIEKIGAMAKADMAKSGICAAVTIAQAILESGWGKSELAKNANNIFGMKKSLSGNTWTGSAWDGKSVYSKQTKEVYVSGPATVQADFRAYKTLQDSVNDHSAYLAGARNGSALRYKGLVGCTDYKKAAQIIKAGGYATAPDYVEKLCRLVEQYDLTRYNTTYKAQATEAAAKTPYTVKVSTQIPILKTPAGTKVKTCPKGIYTIVEEKSGYGHLKSGAGWIQLSKTNKI